MELTKGDTLPFDDEEEESDEEQQIWCELNSLNPLHDTLLVSGERYSLGRSNTCNVEMEFKWLSNKHFEIVKEQNGKILIYNYGSNGTYVNKKAVPKNESCELKNDDEISLIVPNFRTTKRKQLIKNYIAYTVKILNGEEEKKEKENEKDLNETNPRKRKEIETETESENENENENENEIVPPTSISQEKEEEEKDEQILKRKRTNGQKLPTEVKKNENEEKMEKEQEQEQEQEQQKEQQKEKEKEKEQEQESDSESDEEGIAENFVCSICQDIQYNPISVIPCLHNFCGGCISMWSKKSKKCPMCQGDMSTFSRNHTLKNIIESYLVKHKSKKRDKDELEDLDEQDDILTKNKKEKKKNKSSDSESSSESPSSYSDSNTSDSDSSSGNTPNNNNTNTNNKAVLLKQKCRECLKERNDDNYKCDPKDPKHYLCNACRRPFPKRLPNNGKWVVRCEYCHDYYCNQYWPTGCPMKNGHGALRMVKDQDFKEIPKQSFGGNLVELKYLNDCLEDNEIDMDAFFKKCLEDLDNGTYTNTDMPKFHGMSSKTSMCYKCFQQMKLELVYSYRRHIDKNLLPRTVTRRHDCWYGRNCRTQFTKKQHAENYNHVCEQKKKSGGSSSGGKN
ncbi:ubiquitin ligase protein chfr [Anaeramoeba flamelloides]|uniref:E3 ubiquitin-protein ligase CHFR n=1 Tax=Anaeramoeba flamelloides TaxID=1746091 RepID=A0ABQ8XPT5_9EUKA|nr:ubiquitin ligase protein chfr [Anaeramoeba flamelloides]